MHDSRDDFENEQEYLRRVNDNSEFLYDEYLDSQQKIIDSHRLHRLYRNWVRLHDD